MDSVSKQTHVYKTVGDCAIHADVYRPPLDGVRPAIVWLHGGALIFGARSALPQGQLQRYLDAGYTVITADYRLAPEVKLEAIIEDIRDLFEWLRVNGFDLIQIAPERIGVVGHSAGGYLTLMAGFCITPRPKALVSFYGYGDIAGHWYSRPDPHYCQEPAVSKAEAQRAIVDTVITGMPFDDSRVELRWRYYLYCRQQGLWPTKVTGHDPDKEPEWFSPFCPLRNVTQDYPPTLLIHGDQDTDVPFQQSALMAGELARHGVQHGFIALPSRGHVFDTDGVGMRDPEISRVFDQVITFLEKTL